MGSISQAVGRGVPNTNRADVRTVQTLLNRHIHPPARDLVVDGIVGPKTLAAIENFQRNTVRLRNPDGRVDPNGPTLRALNGGNSPAPVSPPPPPPPAPGTGALPPFTGGDRAATVQAIIAECGRQGVTLKAQIAYVLATAQHESNFMPIREGHYLGEASGRAERFRRGLRYYPYYGRGYVQLTWENNYRRYGNLLGVDLVGQPDLALQPNVALYVLVHGMRTGTFTGVGLNRYITATRTDFVNARRIVNGTDRAQLIAGYAEQWLQRL